MENDPFRGPERPETPQTRIIPIHIEELVVDSLKRAVEEGRVTEEQAEEYIQAYKESLQREKPQ